jgi:hypothetical protein
MLVLTLPAPTAHAVAAPGMLFLFVIATLGLGTMFMLAPRLGAPAHSRDAMLGAAAGTLLGVSDVANKGALPRSRTQSGGAGQFAVAVDHGARGRVRHRGLPAAHSRSATPCPSWSAPRRGEHHGDARENAVFGDSLSGDALLSSLQVAGFPVLAGAAVLRVSGHDRVTVGAAAHTA